MGERPEINDNVISMQEENEFLPDRAVVIQCLNWTSLHVAASRGQDELFKKLLDSNPELAEALDSQKRSLLHLASANGHIEIVKKLIEMRPEMCLARDRDGTNPLHVAVMRGKVEVLEVLCKANPHAARARVDKGDRDSILHLCVKYNKFECLKLLLKKFKSEEFVNAKDDAGKNILHLAVADLAATVQRFQIIEHVLSNTKIEVNAKNGSKQTAMDILLLRKGTEPEAVDRNTEDLLRKFNAKRDEDIANPTWITEQRNALIIVAVLMATIAFQAAVTPPGGIWPDTSDGHISGDSVMDSKDHHMYRYFLIFNTISFVASLSTIFLLITEFPFVKRRYVWISVGIMCITFTSMAATYALLIVAITPAWDRKVIFRIVAVGLIVWGGVIAILVLVHIIRQIGNIVGEKNSRNQAVERLGQLGNGRLGKLGRAFTYRTEGKQRADAGSAMLAKV